MTSRRRASTPAVAPARGAGPGELAVARRTSSRSLVAAPAAVRSSGASDLGPEHRDVAGADGQHEVARAGARDDAAATADQDGSKTTRSGGSGTAPAMSAPVTPGTGSSRAGVDVHDDDVVGQGERLAELLGEMLGAAVQMRLEDDDQPAAARDLPGSGQRGAQLGRMVGVVVEDADAARLALELEPAAGAGERR